MHASGIQPSGHRVPETSSFRHEDYEFKLQGAWVFAFVHIALCTDVCSTIGLVPFSEAFHCTLQSHRGSRNDWSLFEPYELATSINSYSQLQTCTCERKIHLPAILCTATCADTWMRLNPRVFLRRFSLLAWQCGVFARLSCLDTCEFA